MDIVLVLFFLLAMIVTTSPYRDYPASRMPDYGLDYDNQELTPTPDDFSDKLSHARTSLDYRYDEESDSRKLAIDVDVDDTAINTNKRFSPKFKNEDVHVDIYNTQEEIIPEEKLQNRKKKINRRKKTKYNSSSDNRNVKYSRNRNVEDNTDNDDYRIRDEDYRENDEKETERFNRREMINRQARRKPRERPINLILRDSDSGYIKGDGEDIVGNKLTKERNERHFNKQVSAERFLEYEFDDMKRVNNLKEKLPVTTRGTTVSLSESSSTSPIQERSNRRANNPDDDTLNSSIASKKNSSSKTMSNAPPLELAGSNKSEVSLAERSRLSILKKVQKKENLNVILSTKPPVLMQVTNQMQTVVLVASDVEKDMPQPRPVVDNSRVHIERAKKLMRHKLVANAKSVKELTNNWDEMICDYIDVSLLNVASPWDYNVNLIFGCLALTVI